MFKKSHTIKSKLSKEEIIEILQSKVENFHRDNSGFNFEGTINSNGEFNIKPTFDYGPRNQFRPEIIGKIHGNQIDLTLGINSFLKNVLWFVLIVEPIFVLYMYYEFKEFQILLFFPFLIIFLIGLKITFNNKANKSIALLETYLK
jgi:hypothetical protein